MKRILVALLVVTMLVGSLPAFAAGKISVVQENFHVVDSYSIYGYAYAKVQNVGDKPIKVNAGLLEIFDAEGDTLTSDDYLRSYAEYLQPDEYTYVCMDEKVEVEAVTEVDDYILTVSGKSDTGKRSIRLPVETSYEPDVKQGYSTYNYMTALVTNDTEDTLFDITVLLVLLDDEDNILYMESDSMYSSKGLTPGSSIVVREDVSSSFMDYFAAKGYTPSKVDAIAYVNVSND